MKTNNKTIEITVKQAWLFQLLLTETRDNHKLQRLTGVSYTESINLLNELRDKLNKL